MRTITEAPPNTEAIRRRFRLADKLQRIVGPEFRVKFDCNSLIGGHGREEAERSQGHQFHLGFASEGSDNELTDVWADDRNEPDVATQFAKGIDCIIAELTSAAEALREFSAKAKGKRGKTGAA